MFDDLKAKQSKAKRSEAKRRGITNGASPSSPETLPRPKSPIFQCNDDCSGSLGKMNFGKLMTLRC